MNIVLIICDALRAQNLSCYGYDKAISPNIDTIASDGAIFNNAFSTTNVTDSSFTTIFTGQYPCVHGMKRHGNNISEKEKSFIDNMLFLPEILHRNGYTTAALDWLGRWHRLGYDFYAGQSNHLVSRNNIKINNSNHEKRLSKLFSKISLLPGRCKWYYSLPQPIRSLIRKGSISKNALTKGGFSRKKKPILSDSAGLSDLAIDYIKKYAKDKKLFLFVHFWDNHIPYTAPDSVVKKLLKKYDYSKKPTSAVLEKFTNTKAAELIHKTTRGKTPKTIGEIRAYYDASIQYVDENIGRIYKTVKELDVAEDTLFIISADHGESLGEHDIYFDHHGLYDTQIKVPLIMAHPMFSAGSKFYEMVQHDNLVPTILDMAQIKVEETEFTGDSLLKLTRGQPWDRNFIFAEEKTCQHKKTIRDHKYKYIKAVTNQKCYYCQTYHCQSDEFYDLENDPKELKNIIDNPLSSEYLEKMETFLDILPKPKSGRITNFEDESLINKRLQSLGYF